MAMDQPRPLPVFLPLPGQRLALVPGGYPRGCAGFTTSTQALGRRPDPTEWRDGTTGYGFAVEIQTISEMIGRK